MLPRAVKKLLGRNLMLALGLVIVLAMSLAALLAPWIAPFDPNALHLDNILEPPSSAFCSAQTALGAMFFPACFTAAGFRCGWALWLWAYRSASARFLAS